MVSYIVGGQSPGGRQVPEYVHDKREATVTKGLADPPAMCLIFFLPGCRTNDGYVLRLAMVNTS